MSFGFLDIAGDLAGQLFANERQEDSQEFAAGQQLQNQQFQERMRATQYQTAVKDLKAAGLNPMLAYHQGGAGTPAGGIASAGLASPGAGSHIAASLQSASQIAVNDAQARKLDAETDLVKEQTKTAPVTREHVQQQIGESAMRIEKIIAETAHSQASAANVIQQTLNLKEAVQQIRATVDNLRAYTKLAGSQDKETTQRIDQNLPEMERILMNLERLEKEMAQPGHANAERAQDSFVGQLGAYLRTLGGLPTAIINKRGGTTINRHQHNTTINRGR